MTIKNALYSSATLSFLVLFAVSGCSGSATGDSSDNDGTSGGDTGGGDTGGGDNGGNVYTIGGTVVGLEGSLELELNGAGTLIVTQDGSFQFSQRAANYDVTVVTTPGLQGCRVDAGVGTATANVSDVIVTCDDRVFFRAKGGTGSNGQELWSSDGTAAGTHLVFDAPPSGVGSRPQWLGILDQRIGLFEADGTLYATDGTSAGTTVLGDMDLGPYELASDRFYFKSQGSLWMTDGSAGGTNELSTIEPFGRADSMIFHSGWLYFEAGPTSSSTSLWKSNGTPGGTIVVTDLNPNNPDDIDSFTPSSTTLFFRATFGPGRSIWKTDGTPGGTVHVVDADASASSSEAEHLTALGAGLVFAHEDDGNGVELWFTDGTVGNATLLTPGSLGDGVVTDVGELNGMSYFAGRAGVPEVELWSSDGTALGTNLFVDLVPGSSPSTPSGFYRFGSQLLFMASEPGLSAYALWATDGTVLGTTVLHNVQGLPDRTQHLGEVLGQHLYLAWYDSSGVQLMATDGTPGGSAMVLEICDGCHADQN